MYLVLNLFRRFGVEYDRKNKIIIVNKPIPVSDFVYLKYLLSKVNEEVKDIRVFTDKLRRSVL